MAKPDCALYCTEDHEGEDLNTSLFKLRTALFKSAAARAGLVLRVGGGDVDVVCPRSGYRLTRWDKIRDWMLGYR